MALDYTLLLLLLPTFFFSLGSVYAVAKKGEADGVEGGKEEEKGSGEFTAGSFIVTQKGLDEAPYRYTAFLTKALEKIEEMDPPSYTQYGCRTKVRITPSGETKGI